MTDNHVAKAESPSAPVGLLAYFQARGLLTSSDVVRVRTAMQQRRPRIGEVLVRQRMLHIKDVLKVLEEQAVTPDRFGEIAIRMGLLSPSAVHAALDLQRSMTPSAITILQEEGIVDAGEALQTLGQYVAVLERRLYSHSLAA